MRVQAAFFALVIGSVTTSSFAPPVLAQSAEDFYKGRQIMLIIGFAPGGGYDAYARLAGRHMGKQLPGSPTIVPQNMPLAGGLRAANYLFQVAVRDGSVIGALANNIMEQQILGGENITYAAERYAWIGRLNPMNEAQIVWRNAGVHSVEDAKLRVAVLGASGPTATPSVYPRVLNNIVGTKFQIVMGYKGAPDSCLAMERGEVSGCMVDLGLVKATKAHWLKENSVSILYQMALQADADFPNVPTYSSLGRSDDERKMLSVYSFSSDVGRSIMAPPEIPADRVEVLRRAFSAMVKDKEFIADAQRAKMDLNVLAGEDLQKIIDDAAQISPAIIQRAKAARDNVQ